MNSIIELLKKNQETVFVDEDGNTDSFALLPPMTESEIAAFEKTLPCPLPDQIRELLRFARGFRGVLEEINFTGPDDGFGLESIFPHAIPLAADGFGNFWIVDLTSESQSWGPVFYACHDAPVMVYQADSLQHFIEQAILFGNDPWKGEIDSVHEDLSHRIWGDNPGVLSHEHCLNSGDPDLKAFAESLDPSWQFIDLRKATLGDGFSWGRYGAKTANKRHGEKRIFAYQKKSPGRRFFDFLR